MQIQQIREYEALISSCNKENAICFLKTIFGKNFGGEEEYAAENISIIGSVTLDDSDGRPKPVLCGFKAMEKNLTERSSRRKQFDDSVKVLKQAFARPYMGNGPVNGVFTQGLFFFCDENGNFRLSLVTSEIANGKHELNNYRRQSFFVESGTQNNTFRHRLCKRISNFAELKEAFNVEKLSDDFFREYKVFYEDIVQYITGARYVEIKKNKYERRELCASCGEIFDQFIEVYETTENAEKAVRNYVKKLMGRLVFVQFLQKKGWLGISAEKNGWKGGDTCFLQNLFKNASDDEKSGFIDKVLEDVLFYAFNTKECDRKFKNKLLKQYKFPFLNGGLFEMDRDDRLKFALPAEAFHNENNEIAATERRNIYNKNWAKERKPYFNKDACGLFDFFDRYNFTIDENDPTDAEVSVDPEMLGKIFENLLEDNKDKGAFYTPKEIVNYMVNESLIAYLENVIQSRKHADLEPESIRNFVLTQDASAFTDDEKTQLNTKLAEVKICDPAIGSGAFPMGILNVLVKCRRALSDLPDERNALANFKRHIIQNNIYGVDIEKGAVDIARLRFWLSLVVDEETPEALPNLDFKIMQGNSLLECYEGIDLSVVAGQGKKRTTAKSSSQVSLVFDEAEAMKQIQKDLNSYFQTQDHDKKNSLKNSISEGVKNYLKFIAPEKRKEIDAMDIPNDKFFLWHTYFYDVFKQGGFDIVIGNPPYVSAPTQLANAQLAKQREMLVNSAKYDSLFQKWDLYIPFIELGIQLCRQNGICDMIVPYPLTNQLYAKVLRKILVEKYDLFEIVDLNGTKVFDNATVSNCIPFIKKAEPQNQIWISKVNDDLVIAKKFEQPLKKLVQDEKTYVWNLTQENRETNRHANMHVLGDYCYVSYGLRPNSDEKTAKGEFKKEDLISEIQDKVPRRKYIEAKDIDRYVIGRVRYLEYGTKRSPAKLVRPTFNEWFSPAKLFFNRLGNLVGTIDYSNQFLHNDSIIGAALWQDLHGVENKSIASSIKKFSTMTRSEMEQLSKNVDLRYLLGVMNSRYASILLTNLRGGDYHIYPEHIRNIPIPSASKEDQQDIIDLVDKILAAKKADPQEKTSDLELQIDKLVYKLYDLTGPEIDIIEKSFAQAKENTENNTSAKTKSTPKKKYLEDTDEEL